MLCSFNYYKYKFISPEDFNAADMIAFIIILTVLIVILYITQRSKKDAKNINWCENAEKILGKAITDTLDKNDIVIFNIEAKENDEVLMELEYLSADIRPFIFVIEINKQKPISGFLAEFKELANNFDTKKYIAEHTSNHEQNTQSINEKAEHIKNHLLSVSDKISNIKKF